MPWARTTTSTSGVLLRDQLGAVGPRADRVGSARAEGRGRRRQRRAFRHHGARARLPQTRPFGSPAGLQAPASALVLEREDRARNIQLRNQVGQLGGLVPVSASGWHRHEQRVNIARQHPRLRRLQPRRRIDEDAIGVDVAEAFD